MIFDDTKQMSFSPLKLLIVDDNDRMREMVKFYVQDLAFEISECGDGLEAIDCYEKTRPDWVLMDWEMKRMDGLEATKHIIKNHPNARHRHCHATR
jgi:CheY-like chemotaxis protein